MPELSHRRRLLVLAICCMSLLIVGLDNTIVNVAGPSLQRDLHTGVDGLQWIIDAYTLVLASLLMLSGSTADRIGRRRMFQTGLALFTLGSLLCSLAPSLGWLVFARVVQAIGGSMLNPVAMSIVTNVFTDPAERARAIGVWSAVFGLSMALGPVVGGVLIGAGLGWRAIFWVNIPVGLAALALTVRFVPESKAARARRPDPVGQALVGGMLLAVTYGIIEGPSRGWGSAEILGCFGLAALLLLGLLWYEPRRAEPLLDLRFFRSAPFSGAVVIAICAFAGLGGFMLMNTLFLQNVRGLSALHAGLMTLPMGVAIVLCGPISGRMVAAWGPRPSLLVAGVLLTLGGLALTGLTASTPYAYLLAAYAVFGAGFAVVNAPITNTAVSGMPNAQAGVAAAVASTSRQIGNSLGVAIGGSVVATASRAGFARASHTGWWIIAGYGAAVFVLGIITTGRWARATAAATAARLDPERKVAVPAR